MSSSPSSSYWCYRCSRFVRIWYQDAVVCPDCDGGFLEEVEAPPRLPTTPTQPRRPRRPSGDRSPFNPVIVLRGGAADTPVASFELYYDDGAGSGLRPLPPSMSEFLMGSGFDRLIDQLNQIEANGGGPRGCHHPPASKASVDSMPTVEIAARHIILDSHCAVCTEAFEVGAKAREMPCKHIYHQDCILPWLAMRNSCPVCRHEMPVDGHGRDGDAVEGGDGSEEDMVGLTIWRLPGGGFAVGRFSGARRAGERELPVVYTEMDGGFNNSGAPRGISWSSRGSRERESRGVGGAFRSFFSFFGWRRSSSSSSSSSSSRSGSNSSPSSPHRNHRSGAARRTGLVGASNVASPIWY